MMSDRPLFGNADDQEAAYAPQQLPEAAAEGATGAEEGGRDADGGIFVLAATAGTSGVGTGPATVRGRAARPRASVRR